MLKDLGDTVRWPAKMKIPAGARDKKKHCDFHSDQGHNTDKCIALRYEVVELLKKGYLADLLTKRGKQNGRKSNDQPRTSQPSPERPPIIRTINCIIGGSDVSRVLSSAAKRHCRGLRSYHANLDLAAEEVANINF